MARLLFLILIGYVLYRMFRRRPAATEVPQDVTPGAETYRDPVCGVYVTEDDAVVGRLAGEKIYFCSRACLDRFQEQLENKAEK